jgi:hypothetical protein
MHPIVKRLAVALPLTLAAFSAFAQSPISGGTGAGNQDPVTIGGVIVGIVAGLGAVAATLGWLKVGYAFVFGHHVETRVLYATGAGTLIIACAGFLAVKMLGGGGLGTIGL